MKSKAIHNGNPYQNNNGGIIKAPKPVKDQPKSSVVKGSDLRAGK